MYLLKTSATFDSAHFLSGYNGKCSNIHGHTWKLEVTVKSSALIKSGEKRGMVIDFSNLKSAVKELADRFDHTLIYEAGTLGEATVAALEYEGFTLTEVYFRPTAENFARFFFKSLAEELPVKSVAVYETPVNCAVYEEE